MSNGGNAGSNAVRVTGSFTAGNATFTFFHGGVGIGSACFVNLKANDATMTTVSAVCTSGLVTLTGNAIPTGAVAFEALVIGY